MILIDVTHTLATGLRTGTQRVVRKIVEHTIGANPPSIAVAAVDGRFHRLSDAGMRTLLDPPASSGNDGGGGAQQQIGALLRRVPPVFDRFQLWNFNRRVRPALLALVEPEAVMFGPDDVLVLVDAFWGGTATMQAARTAARSGAQVIPMIHDMIPVTHPGTVHPATATTYAPRLRRTFATASGVIANSRFTADETRRFLAANRLDLPVDHFLLGHDLGSSEALDPPVRTDFAYVMVGTIEPRKGHALVLDAFEQRWADGSDATLTFVGKMGWAEDALKDRCRDHPELGRRLFIHHDLNDIQLRAAIRHADASLLASSVEGFGLPLVESLALGVPVIASDIPVFREVGGDTALFFRCGSADALVAAIGAFERDPAPWRTRAAAFRWPDWREAADTFLAAVTRLRDAARQSAK